MQILWGAIIVLVGILFLAHNLALFGFEFDEFIADFWPLVLIAVGVYMIYHQRHRTYTEVEIDGGTSKHSGTVGDANFKPKSLPPNGLLLKHGLGDLRLDLTECVLRQGENRVQCSHGAGDLIITLPTSIPLKAEASVGMGDIYLLGRKTDGVGCSLDHEDAEFATADQKITLSAKVGMGQIKISQV
jgi:predicted membrane protein